MARRFYSYSDASRSSHGEMVCGACRKLIHEGQYRIRETAEAYITHHRACCSDDSAWAKLDAETAAENVRVAAQLADAIAFRDKWDCGDLDDLIDGLEVAVERATPEAIEREATLRREQRERREREAAAKANAERAAKLAQLSALKAELVVR